MDGVERRECRVRFGRLGSSANHGRLLLAVGADFVKGLRVNPETRAARALERPGRAKGDSGERPATARAQSESNLFLFRPFYFCPAVRTELGANRDHSETRRASDGGKTRAAMFTRHRSAGASRTAHWAIKRRSFHEGASVVHEMGRS